MVKSGVSPFPPLYEKAKFNTNMTNQMNQDLVTLYTCT